MHLSDATVRSLPFIDGQRDYPDDLVRGLSILIGKRTKTFMLLTRANGIRKRQKLGTYPDELSLARARELARDILAKTRLSKIEIDRTTLGDAFELYQKTHLARLRPGTREEQTRLIRRHFLRLAERNLDDIKSRHVAPLIDAIPKQAEQRSAFVAASIFFNWCAKRGYIEVSPIARLDAPRKAEPRSRVLTETELVAVWRSLPNSDYGTIVRLLILTAQRANQWAAARSEYLDGDTITWPSSAMKAARSHTLLLTPQVRALIPSRNGLLFPSMADTPFSDWHRNKQRLNRASGVKDWVHHDLRRVWATIAAEKLDVQPHIIDAVLAHQSGTAVSRIYNRARYLSAMRDAIETWERYLHSLLFKLEDTNGRGDVRDLCTA
jgi:integrase